ncbi:hypothetical protein SAMN04488556_3161 [Halostagnicola kamekurae]|uniref:Uncharacterized protein n=1 Tax=Halostagnicola kamekurae TaxID=619731 RepID=A0A1I6TJA4_9EURY|nr:hypothetical protein SAMN04488556_3161 [Halostagnicola kamekurae]
MAKWLRILTKIHHYHYPVIGFCGLLWTVVFSRPGTHLITVGPIQLDVFYILVVSFGILLVLADEYNPEDYGLGPSESEK